VLIGLALIVRMALLGNPVGIVLGILFALAGAGRLYVARKTG
jgi:ABC-type amino acid transport system permease subunit